MIVVFDSAIKVFYLVGLILYGLCFLLTVVLGLRHAVKGSGRRCSISGVFYVLVLIFLAARLSFCSVTLLGLNLSIQFSLNVASDCFFFSCFSLIVIHWAEANSSTTMGGESKLFSSVVGWIFFGFQSCAVFVSIGRPHLR